MHYSILKRAIPVALGMLLFTACKPWDEDRNTQSSAPAQTEGWAPIYDSSNTARSIKTVPARAIEHGGKIYTKDKVLYQVEAGKGIHVINISDPLIPVKTGFIRVSGCQEMAILGNTLYTNNLNDLVTLDISDPADVKLTDRVTNAFHLFSPWAPPTSGWYECINADKGDVVGWEMKTLYHPKCR